MCVPYGCLVAARVLLPNACSSHPTVCSQPAFLSPTPALSVSQVKEFLDGFETPYDIVGGNHDLEGIDEFNTDEENLEAYLRLLGKKTPQFCHQVRALTQ